MISAEYTNGGTEGIKFINPEELARILQDPCHSDKVLLLDGRSFFDFSSGSIKNSTHIPSPCLIKRRLQQDKISVTKFLDLSPNLLERTSHIVLYDKNSSTFEQVSASEGFTYLVATKLAREFPKIYLLRGGFSAFQPKFPQFCTFKDVKLTAGISEPSISITNNQGPTKILPFVFLGCEEDALSKQFLQKNDIKYILNVSANCPKADFIQDSHFMRIPVNDNCSDKLLCHFVDAFNFLEKVKMCNERVLVHCMAGISRSPTLVIAYVMQMQKAPYEQAYKYVKEKRPIISPNFNFIGQLMEFDRTLREKQTLAEATTKISPPKKPICLASEQTCSKRQRLTMTMPKLNIEIASQSSSFNLRTDLSPSSALARISLTAKAE